MADAKISELPVLATPESIDKLLIVDTSESTTKHITYGNLVSALQGANVTLASLGDVNTTGLSNGQVLKYNASAGEWQPGSDTAGILYTDLSIQIYQPSMLQHLVVDLWHLIMSQVYLLILHLT